MRLKLLTLALALAAISLPSHGEDLLDAYREARANDPGAVAGRCHPAATGEGVNQARALLLPQVNGDLTLSQTNGGSGTSYQDPTTGQFINTSQFGHTRTRSLNATLSQTMFDFSKYANLKAAHSAATPRTSSTRRPLQNLYVRVAAAYFGVLTSEDAADLRQGQRGRLPAAVRAGRPALQGGPLGDHRRVPGQGLLRDRQDRRRSPRRTRSTTPARH